MGFPVDITLGRCGSGSEQQAVPSSNNNNGTYHNEQRHGMLREAAQDYLRTLKEERRKVEGFKRELPLCIQLLDDAIKTAEEKLVHGTDGVLPMGSEKENGPENPRPTLEEFMPLKRRWPEPEQPSQISSDGEREDLGGTTTKNTKHQPAWMTEAPVWNQTTSRSAERKMIRDPEQLEQEQSCVTSSQQRPTGGAFLPFQQLRVSSNAMPVVSRPKPRSGGFCADLNLGVSGERPSDRTHTLRAASDVEVGSIGTAAAMQQTMPDTPHTCNTDMGIMVGNVDTSDRAGGGGNSSSSTRKARRCWSPELHRRFVSALHQLGGSHIATPKQLRELMKVDGLTNDEVKSHLQKYRLHTRRPGSSSSPHESAAAGQSSSTQTQLVVVGGIWMPPQHGGAASPAVSQPGSHNSGVSDGPAPMGKPASQPGPQFFHSTSLPLDYFAACIHNGTPATGPPMQMLLHRQPIFEPPRAAGTAQSQSSPQGPLQATSHLSGATQGSSSETYESGEEEAKSQSTSWKLCNSRQAAPLREDLVDSSPREEPEQIEETQVQDARA